MDKQQTYPEAVTNKNDAIKKVFSNYSMFFALIAIWIIFALLTDGNFVSARNISNILRQVPIIGLISIGMVFCLITGNIDLSVGSVCGFCGAMAAILIMQFQMNPITGVIITLLIGIGISSAVGFLVAYQKVPSFIVTLGCKLIFDGAMLLLLKSQSIKIDNSAFLVLGNAFVPPPYSTIVGGVLALVLVIGIITAQRKRSSLGIRVTSWKTTIVQCIAVAAVTFIIVFMLNQHEGLPVSFVLLVVLVAVFSFVLNKTRYGRNVYAVGGNKLAARLAGVNNEKTIMITFVIVGFFTALAGLVLASRLGSASSTAGENFEVDTISACVIGGVSLSGGRGNIIVALVGVLVIASLSSGMSLFNLTLPIQNIVRGLVILAAVLFDVTVRKLEV